VERWKYYGSWIKLKEIKETNPVEVANYAINSQIDDEPAFDWWVKDILKKQKRLIKRPRIDISILAISLELYYQGQLKKL
jgi:hypothetical protein